MNPIKSRLLPIACLLTALAPQAHALTVLSFGDQYSIGVIVAGQGSPAEQASFVNILIDQAAPSGPTVIGSNTYTRTSNVFAPLPDANGTDPAAFSKQDNSNTTFNLGTGYTYLIGKYDAANAGTYVWYVAGLTGEVQMPATMAGTNGGNQGLSHSIAYGPTPGNTVTTPDGGATVVLLGLGLTALAFLRRKLA